MPAQGSCARIIPAGNLDWDAYFLRGIISKTEGQWGESQ